MINYMINEVDIDEDGKINFNEFVTIMMALWAHCFALLKPHGQSLLIKLISIDYLYFFNFFFKMNKYVLHSIVINQTIKGT
jgi:hypothetical protein